MDDTYVCNKSSICTVQTEEKEICQAVSLSTPVTANVTSEAHDKTSATIEMASHAWPRENNCKNSAIDGKVLLGNTVCLSAQFKPPA